MYDHKCDEDELLILDRTIHAEQDNTKMRTIVNVFVIHIHIRCISLVNLLTRSGVGGTSSLKHINY